MFLSVASVPPWVSMNCAPQGCRGHAPSFSTKPLQKADSKKTGLPSYAAMHQLRARGSAPPPRWRPVQPQRDTLAPAVQLAYLLEADRLRIIYRKTLEPVLDVRQLESQLSTGKLVRSRTHASSSPLIERRTRDAHYVEHLRHGQERVIRFGHAVMSTHLKPPTQWSDGLEDRGSFARLDAALSVCRRSGDETHGADPGQRCSICAAGATSGTWPRSEGLAPSPVKSRVGVT